MLDLTDPHRPAPRQPVFNIPGIVALLSLVMVGIHVLRTYVLSDDLDIEVLGLFSFIPGRYDPTRSSTFPAALARNSGLSSPTPSSMPIGCIWA